MDSIYNILWKLLEDAGGIPAPGDLAHDLLRKYLEAIKTGTDDENDPASGDSFMNLLVKVLRRRGGFPSPGDNEWNLLVKWLAIEGECRGCGDLVYTLWRKIGESILGEPEPNGLLSGLTAYWMLDESSGLRLDSVNNYDLTQNGTVPGIAGALNNAADFPNTANDYLSNPSSDFGTSEGHFSFSTWIRVKSIFDGSIFGKEEFVTGGWSLFLAGGPSFALQSTADFNTERVVSEVLVIPDISYHVVASFNGAGAFIWVNGVINTDAHLGATNSSVDFQMGQNADVVVDETAIWIGRALTSADAVVLYNGGAPLPFSAYD